MQLADRRSTCPTPTTSRRRARLNIRRSPPSTWRRAITRTSTRTRCWPQRLRPPGPGQVHTKRDPFADTPARQSESPAHELRGQGRHELLPRCAQHKLGGAVAATKLKEEFTLGLTDPTLNSPCVDADGAPIRDPTLGSDSHVRPPASTANPDFVPGLLPTIVARGGLFQFNGDATIKRRRSTPGRNQAGPR